MRSSMVSSILFLCMTLSGCYDLASDVRYSIAKKDAVRLKRIIDRHTLKRVEQVLGVPLMFQINGPDGADDAGLIEIAVAAGSDVNEIYNDETPLMLAAMWLHEKNARSLLKNGANPTIRSRDGRRAVDLIAEGGNKESIKVLHALLGDGSSP